MTTDRVFNFKAAEKLIFKFDELLLTLLSIGFLGKTNTERILCNVLKKFAKLKNEYPAISFAVLILPYATNMNFTCSRNWLSVT